MTHGFVKLGDPKTLNAINQQIKDIKAMSKLRSSTKKLSAPLKDYSHLTGQNLEDNDMVERKAPRFTVTLPDYCGRCDDGFLRVDRTTTRMCPYCEIPRRRIKALNRLSLPAGAVNMHLDKYEWDNPLQEQVINQLISHMMEPQNNQGPGAFMFGQPGNGKSSILYAVARWACLAGYRVIYSTHDKLLEEIKDNYDSKRHKDPVEYWLFGYGNKRRTILLLDEIGGRGGSGSKSAWMVSRTNEIIGKIHDYWQGGQLCVLMTTNIHPQQLFSTLLNRASEDRLLQMLTPIQMVGQSRRTGPNREALRAKWGLR
ncbi:MAG: hypothetical protein Unbinned2299contig1001_4 [Prokaryotic dsDNA virus sp.]|nr:MAG: hypothetical protein Unbinned2299contig1001_4 [Prokaryotic dsDNA virus sp.]|tara:strand:+ start:11010 stop:11948 length:939 start_codon:yes stop_codon:yes gene_type:complete